MPLSEYMQALMKLSFAIASAAWLAGDESAAFCKGRSAQEHLVAMGVVFG